MRDCLSWAAKIDDLGRHRDGACALKRPDRTLLSNSANALLGGWRGLARLLYCLCPLLLVNPAMAATSVTLAWDPSPDSFVIGYRMYLGGSPGTYTNSFDVGLNLTATVTELAVGGTYYFTVRAVGDNAMESEPSNEVFYTAVNAPAEYPTNVTDSGMVTQVKAGTLRNDFTGFVGFKFETGSDALQVASLGRYALGGNAGTHIVKLVRASDGADVPGASVTVSMSGATPGTFQYQPLASTVSLQPNTAYALLSAEQAGGDTWYDFDASVNTVAGVSPKCAAWGNLPGDLFLSGTASAAYGPASLKFASSGTTNGSSNILPALVTQQALGTPRNDFTGWVGMQLKIGSAPLQVNALGRYIMQGNVRSHSIKLVNAATGADVSGAGVTLQAAGAAAGTYKYASLPAPVTLSAGSTYLLLTSEENGGDKWYNNDTVVSTFPFAQVLGGAWGYGTGTWYQDGAKGACYGPVSLLGTEGSVSPTAASGSGGFITEWNPGTVRNDFSGYVGLCVTVGNSPIAVNQLGRYAASGNSSAHVIKIVRSDTGADVPGGAVNVSMSGAAPREARYATLQSPVTLQANTRYYIVSQEGLGGDDWHHSDTRVKTTKDATADSGVWSPGGTTWFGEGSNDQSFGPIDFKYTVLTNTSVAESRLILSQSLGTPRANFAGWLGVRLQVGATPLVVTSLGRIAAPGSSRPHTVKIVSAADGKDVPGAIGTVNMAGATAGQYTYTLLPSPVTLLANTIYYLVSSEESAGDMWYNTDTTVTTGSAAAVLNGAWSFGDGTWYEYGIANSCYGPLDMKFTLAGAGGASGSTQVERALVSNQTTTRSRNDFTGFVGTRFQVGGEAVTVTRLGRYIAQGNSRTHVVKLVRASDNTDVPGGLVVVDAAGKAPGYFAYTSLAYPVTLSAGETYLLMTEELEWGDIWYDGDTILQTSGAASIISAAWSFENSPWNLGFAGSSGYGPVDLKYLAGSSDATDNPAQPFISSQNLGQMRNDFTGWVGMKVVVGSKAMAVKSLGRLMCGGNSGVHNLRIVRGSDLSTLYGGQVTVSMSGTPGQYVYAPLTTPARMEPGETYYVLSSEVSGGDSWYNYDTRLVTTSDAAVLTGAWAWATTGPVFLGGYPDASYGPVNFEYTLVQ